MNNNSVRRLFGVAARGSRSSAQAGEQEQESGSGVRIFPSYEELREVRAPEPGSMAMALAWLEGRMEPAGRLPSPPMYLILQELSSIGAAEEEEEAAAAAAAEAEEAAAAARMEDQAGARQEAPTADPRRSALSTLFEDNAWPAPGGYARATQQLRDQATGRRPSRSFRTQRQQQQQQSEPRQ